MVRGDGAAGVGEGGVSKCTAVKLIDEFVIKVVYYQDKTCVAEFNKM